MAKLTGDDAMKRPFLVGPRLYLRAFEESDITEEYLGWLNDPEVTRYLGVGKFPETPATVRKYLERFAGATTDFIYAIVERGSGDHIGTVTLNGIQWLNRTVETGLVIGRKDLWGKGYAFEAWSLVIEYALVRLGLRRVTAGSVVDNKGSIAVLRRLGFQEEGRLRQAVFVNGQYLDVVRFGLLRDEFHKLP